MAKFITVAAAIVDLPAAKKGKYAGKVRHDVLTIRPEQNGTKLSMSMLPEYARTMLGEGKKVVMYKSNKAYDGIVEALGMSNPKNDNGKVKTEAEELAEARAMVAAKNASLKAEQNAKRKVKKEAYLAEVASNKPAEPSIADIMAQAEADNAKRDLIAKVNKSNLSKDAKAQVLALIG